RESLCRDFQCHGIGGHHGAGARQPDQQRHESRLDGQSPLRTAGRGAGEDGQSVKALFPGSDAERKNALRSACVFLAVALISAVLSLFLVDNFSVLSRLNQFVQDWEIASVFAPHEAQDPDIVIVAVDEATLARFPYRSPVDRQFLSNLIQQLAAHQPAAIESDFLLDQPTEQSKDLALARTLRDTKVPLVISYIASHDIVTPEQKAFEDAMVPPNVRALANLPTDQFDTARYVFPGHMVDGHYLPG